MYYSGVFFTGTNGLSFVFSTIRDAILYTLNITPPSACATEDAMYVDEMDAVNIHPITYLPVLFARYHNEKVLTIPLKKRTVSQSSSVNGKADKNEKTETPI